MNSNEKVDQNCGRTANSPRAEDLESDHLNLQGQQFSEAVPRAVAAIVVVLTVAGLTWWVDALWDRAVKSRSSAEDATVDMPRSRASSEDSVVTGPIVESVENSASRTPEAAPGSNLFLFGSNLATADSGAEQLGLGQEWPTELQDTSVTIIDSADNSHLAGLQSVSTEMISLAVPDYVSLGPASLVVRRSDEQSEPFPIEITHVAPGLFSANLDGTGPGWGDAVRVNVSGEESWYPVSTIDAPLGSNTTTPISLGAVSDNVYLVLWATGIRGWIRDRVATVRGMSVDVFDVAAYGPGHDQVGLGPLSRTLVGRGEVEITLTIDGQHSNTVTVYIE